MIVTLTLNPALDKSTSVDRLVPEKKMRCAGLQLDPGGGGINVSKAIQKLGGDNVAVYPVGGSNSDLITELLQEQGIRTMPVPVRSLTRESFSVMDQSTGQQYRFVVPGPAIRPEETEAVLQTLQGIEPRPAVLVVSGSLPEGMQDNIFSRLSAIAKALNARLIVDTSGPALRKAMEAGAFLLKPNLSELSALSGKESLQLHEVEEAARDIIGKGYAEVLVVSLGAGGAMLVTADQVVRVAAPTVKRQSTVGAGDSMVGGMAWMLTRGASYADMVRFGVACGTAATMNPGTQLFHASDAHALYEWIKGHA
jgi:6-phosphofructokinase 2